jgi:hypothetical protein
MTKETKQDKAQALSKAIHAPALALVLALDEEKTTQFHLFMPNSSPKKKQVQRPIAPPQLSVDQTNKNNGIPIPITLLIHFLLFSFLISIPVQPFHPPSISF